VRFGSQTLEMPRSEPVIAVAAQPSADAKERRAAVVSGMPMAQLLGSISDELSQAAPFDLASRLAFLTVQRKQGA
jgi:hypothetical protein